ncbi:MAG: nucleotidyltransferase domain-containing protein [Candidatus Bathyarchaeia archaeon]
MMRLPEKVRKVLERIIKQTTVKDDVEGLGLFGSWSRGDASPSSDIDLLVFVRRTIPNEYVERTVAEGLMIDLDVVPARWIQEPATPELDQKIYEAQILYDRDWKFKNMKLLMSKLYSSPERVEIRTGIHVIEADIHLSRATSALSKGDYMSTQLFASTAMENILRIPLEITLEPFSNSRFIEKTEAAAEKLGFKEMFNDYLELAQLYMADKTMTEEKMKLFKTIWDELNFTVRQNLQAVERLHFKVKSNLKYYFNPAFMQGAVLRTASMINAKKFTEAAHYLNSIFLNLLENYALMKSFIEKQRIDLTTLLHSIKNLEKANPENYQNIIAFLNLKELEKAKAAESIQRAKENILKLRMERKRLIKTHISKVNAKS